MCRTVVTLTIVFFSSVILMFKQNDYIIKHEIGLIEYYNRSACEYLRLKNVKPNRTYRAYSLSVHTLTDWNGDSLKVNLKGYKFVNNLFSHKIFDFDFKICEALRKNFFGLADHVLKSGNITKCPIKKGYYILNNCNLNDHDLPPFIPAGRYRLVATVIYNGYTVANGSVYSEIIYKVKH